MPNDTPTTPAAENDSTSDQNPTESGSSSTPNYYRVDPPTDRRPPEYSYVQRRAEILDFVVAAGGPAGVENTRLAERYDVNRSTIKRDLDALSGFVSSLLADGEDVMFRTLALHDRVVADLLSEDDWRASKAAYDLHRDFVDWVGVQPGKDTSSPGDAVNNQTTGLGSGPNGFLSEKNREHFDKLAAEASEATAPNTTSTEGRDDGHEAAEADTNSDAVER